MPTKLTIEFFVDYAEGGEFQSAADSAVALIAFLRGLDGITTPKLYFETEIPHPLRRENLSLKQEVTVYTPEQAQAMGYILSGWAHLSILKRVTVSAGYHSFVITHETKEVDGLMLRLLT